MSSKGSRRSRARARRGSGEPSRFHASIGITKLGPLAVSVMLVMAWAFWSPVAEARSLNQISKLSYGERGDTTVLRLRCSSKPMFSVFKLERPPRLTIDLANSELRGLGSLIDIDSWAVSQVATTQFRTNASTIARVMVNFRRRAHYDVRTSGREVVIKIVPYKARPKGLKGANTADLKRARDAEQRAQKAAATARAMARRAQAELERLDSEAARARRDAERARAQMESTKRKMAKLSKQARRTKDVEAELAKLARQARSARLEADRARSVAAKAQQINAKQAKVARRARAAEARSVALAKEANEAKSALALARRSAHQAQQAARHSHQALQRSRADAAAARAEAKKQQALVAQQRTALAGALKVVRAREAELRASRRESRQSARRVSRLEAEVTAAKRASKGAAVNSPAARRLQRALAALSRANAEAQQSTRRLHQVRVALTEAHRARKQADTSRRVAERARRVAEGARAQAIRQRAEERVRRQAAERAQKLAARQAAALKVAAERVSSKKQRLALVSRRVAELEKALRESQQREKAQRGRVQQARRAMQDARQRSRRAANEKQRLESALTAALKAQGTLVSRLANTKLALVLQQKQARTASAAVARLRRAEAEAQRRVVNARNARARRDARTAAAEASRRLQVARSTARSAKLASSRAKAEVERLQKRQRRISGQAKRAARRLTAARGRLEQIDSKLSTASTRLTAARASLARISGERRREETSRRDALRARRQEEARLALAKKQRRRAELQRRQAKLALGKVAQRLNRAKAAREAEEARLAQAQARLAQLQSKGQQRKAQLAGIGKQLRQERAKLAALRRSWKKPKVTKATAVRNISFADKQRFAEVHIRLDGNARPRVHREKGQLVLELRNAQLPRLLRRTLDTTAFEGPVKAISSFVTGDKEPRVFVKVDLTGSANDKLTRVSDGLVWRFKKPARFAAAPRSGKRQVAGAKQRTYSFRTMPVAAANTKRTRRFKRRRYSGRRIDLDFKGADIHNILRLLSQVGNVNIVTSDDVRGKVTIRMRNVPWDQALDVILRAKGLGQVREGNLVRVAQMADLEKEREAEISRQKQVALLQPLETRLIPLSYADAAKVLSKLQYTLSPRGKLTFDERTNMVIARDIPSNLNLMEKMIRNLDTQTPQVMIEARIIEARTNYVKEIGIQWGGSFMASGANGNSTGLAFPNQIGIGGGGTDGNTPTAGLLFGQEANPNFAVNLPAATGANSGGAIGLTLGSISGVFNINLRLSAAETRGDIRIVSAPRITTLDNVEAKIEQGVTIPFSQVSASGVQTTFKDAKLNLTVKPHVTADGSVVMKVKVERNEPDFTNTGARGQPTILKKQADTEMLVKDGDTAVIGGIYTTRDGRAWQKVPWFADIPVIGWFFKNRRDVSDREEVLVFITPRIINRAQSIGR